MKENKKRWSVAGFVDWNDYTMDELVSYLEKAIEYEAKAKEDEQDILKLIDFYKSGVNNPELKEISEKLYRKHSFFSSGLAFSICRLTDYYKEHSN